MPLLILDKKSKIALVGYNLAFGGQERVFSTVSEMLADSGFEVHVIVLEDIVEFSHYGKLINLGKYSKFQKYFELRKNLKSNHFDFIIDFRYRINPLMELVFLYYIFASFKTIYTIHSSNLVRYFTSNQWVAQQILKKAHTIVSVSSAMNEKIKNEYNFLKGLVIYNSISEKVEKLNCDDLNLPFRYCIAIGRLVKMKQFDKLVETYFKSDLPSENVHLVILGDGEEKRELQNQIDLLNISDLVHLMGFQKNTFCYSKNAEFLVLTSEYEGFPMVILEALQAGIPVVSFDCETGPNEMIPSEFNGLLVENQNFEKLQDAMNRMIQNPVFLSYCKSNATASVAKFSTEVIREKWLNLIQFNTITK